MLESKKWTQGIDEEGACNDSRSREPDRKDDFGCHRPAKDFALSPSVRINVQFLPLAVPAKFASSSFVIPVSFARLDPPFFLSSLVCLNLAHDKILSITPLFSTFMIPEKRGARHVVIKKGKQIPPPPPSSGERGTRIRYDLLQEFVGKCALCAKLGVTGGKILLRLRVKCGILDQSIHVDGQVVLNVSRLQIDTWPR